MLQTPAPTADYLGHGEGFWNEGSRIVRVLNGEEDRHQRKANTAIKVIWLSFIQIMHSYVFPAIPLVKKAVDSAMELAENTWLGLEPKAYIKGSISCSLNKDEMCEC